MTGINTSELVLGGDIGGTKTFLGLFELVGKRPTPRVIEAYPSGDASGLEPLIERFLAQHGQPFTVACFGIAGPVKAGVSRVTNLPWVVSETELKGRFGWEQVRLINDLAATAVAVPLLTESELYPVNRGRPEPGGAFGIVAPGTGLGMALAIMAEGKVRAIASEGGHVDFAARNDKEMDLLKHLLGTIPRVSVERLASGPGLFTIYSWLREYRNHTEPVWLEERMNSADPSKVISEVALEKAEPLCVEALDLFVSIIGAAAGNLALTGTTTGGIYLGGGIPPKILPKLVDGAFVEAFTAKGRFKDFLADVPVRVILNDKAALLGAAACAFEQVA